jgi:hypothetical protein
MVARNKCSIKSLSKKGTLGDADYLSEYSTLKFLLLVFCTYLARMYEY